MAISVERQLLVQDGKLHLVRIGGIVFPELDQDGEEENCIVAVLRTGFWKRKEAGQGRLIRNERMLPFLFYRRVYLRVKVNE